MSPTATHTPRALTNMIAVSGKAGAKILGYVVWFAVPDRPVKLNALRRNWIDKALDPKVLPQEPRPLFLFKRAMREQAGKLRHADGTVTETDVREVAEDADWCIYQISRVVRDQENRLVNYPKAMRVVFNKGELNNPLNFEPLRDASDGKLLTPMADLLPMQQAIEEFYDENGKLISGRQVRGIVREYIRSTPERVDQPKGTIGLSGENLRGKGGGVYFVKIEHKDALDSLAEALADLHSDGSAFLYMVPLADGATERELIRRHHVENAMRETQEAIAEAAVLLRKDRKQAVRTDHVEHHWRRLQTLRRRAKEYAAILREEQGDVNDALDMMQKQLEKLPSI